MRRKITNLGIISLILLSIAPASLVNAHGERSQEPFLRMLSVQWYDTKWSTDKVAVNEEVVLSGKFHLHTGWPEAIAKPDVAFMHVYVPGPVFVRKGVWVNGKPMVRSASYEIGRDYEYKIVMKARRPGMHHLHPMLNIKDGGPNAGPGNWVAITGDAADFTNPVTTLTGETVDLETWGWSRVRNWHILWAILAGFWLVWWLRRPLLAGRNILLRQGREDELITPMDRKVGMGLGILTLALIFYGYFSTIDKFPVTIPLQAGLMVLDPLPVDEDVVEVELQEAHYDIPGRSVRMTVNVTNGATSPVRLGEFATASIRWLNADVAPDVGPYPQDLIALNGLDVENDTPIQPGETRTLNIVATDAAWETERLALLIYDPDSRFGGMLFFYDENGKRHKQTFGGPLIPTFTAI